MFLPVFYEHSCVTMLDIYVPLRLDERIHDLIARHNTHSISAPICYPLQSSDVPHTVAYTLAHCRTSLQVRRSKFVAPSPLLQVRRSKFVAPGP